MMFKIPCYIIRFVGFAAFGLLLFFMFDSELNYKGAIILAVVSSVFDIFIDAEKIKLDKEKIYIFSSLTYETIISKKPRVILLKDIEKIKSEKINLKCFSNLTIYLKNDEQVVISNIDIKKEDLEFLNNLKR